MLNERSLLVPFAATVMVAGIAAGCGGASSSSPSSIAPSKAAAASSASSVSAAQTATTPTGPVTADQAKEIAAKAAGGTALSAEQEDEDGTQVFGVRVQVGSAFKDVKVRVSDGAVLKIEDDIGEAGGEGQGEAGGD